MSGYENTMFLIRANFLFMLLFQCLCLIMGAAGTINAVGTEDSISKYVLYFGLALMGGTLFFWFKQVVQRASCGFG